MFKWLNLHIVIYFSYDCNLRCSYCVIDFNKFSMSDFTINDILSFIVKSHSKFNEIYVEFIWWEPLLQKDKISKILSFKNIPSNVKFQITTNWTIIDDYIYNSFIVNIDKVNLSFNENYFLNNNLFKNISSKIVCKKNININFIYDPKKNINDIENNFLLILKEWYKHISILPIVLVYQYTDNDFINLIKFINFVKRYTKIVKVEFLYYIQEKNQDFEFTIDPKGNILWDNMWTAETFFNVDNKKNISIWNIKDMNIEEIYDKLKGYSYIKYLKNLSIYWNTKQDYDNLLFLSNLLKKYNDEIPR